MAKSNRQKIRKTIIRYLSALDPGDEFMSAFLHGYVMEKTGCPDRIDTTVRYLNGLKHEGIINYHSVNRKQGRFMLDKPK